MVTNRTTSQASGERRFRSLRLGWTDPQDRWTVALSGRNLTNEVVLDACTLSIATRGVWHPIYQDERTWALEANYRFGM